MYYLTNVRPLFDTPKVKENKTHDSFFKELREQALITLMGFPSLLNRQMSRSYPDFLPDHTHRERFLSLRTNVLPNLPRLVQSTPAEMTRQLQEWAENIRVYALQNPGSTGTEELGIPSSFCERLIKQAKPAALGQGTLLAIVGSGAGVQGYLGPDAFFQAPGRSAHLFKQTLARLCAWENGTEMFSMELIDACIMSGALPFIDVCPWVRAEGQDLVTATGFLRDYMRISRPRIILSLADLPASIIGDNFRQDSMRKPDANRRILQRVGSLNVIHYCGPGTSLDNNDRNSTAIQIPCLHFGRVRFEQNPASFYRVLDITCWILLLTMQIFIDQESQKDMAGLSREVQCYDAKKRVEEVLQQTGIDIELSQAIESLQDYWKQNLQHQMNASNKRRALAAADLSDARILVSSVCADQRSQSASQT